MLAKKVKSLRRKGRYYKRESGYRIRSCICYIAARRPSQSNREGGKLDWRCERKRRRHKKQRRGNFPHFFSPPLLFFLCLTPSSLLLWRRHPPAALAHVRKEIRRDTFLAIKCKKVPSFKKISKEKSRSKLFVCNFPFTPLFPFSGLNAETPQVSYVKVSFSQESVTAFLVKRRGRVIGAERRPAG